MQDSITYRLSILRRGAPLLYGSRWKRPLAELIGVSERTLHRWLSGESDTVPISAVSKLDHEIELHHTRLSEYLHERKKER